MKSFWRILIVPGLLVVFTTPLSAQTAVESIERVALQVYNDELVLFNVDNQGNIVRLETLSDFGLNYFTFQETDWEILVPGDLVVSPDGQHVAFTADNRSNREASLFIYTLGESGLHQKSVAGWARVVWSPQSDALLLVPPGVYVGGGQPHIEDAYLYELASGSLVRVTNASGEHISDFRWLPDGEQIMYVGPRETCAAQSCIPTRNLYLVDRARQLQTPLTDFAPVVAAELNLDPVTYYSCDASNPVWSASDERIYYDVVCTTGGEFDFSSLYSVSLSGDNRLEVELADTYPDDIFAVIENIYPIAQDGNIYIAINDMTDQSEGGELIITGHWRVMMRQGIGQYSSISSEALDIDSVNTTALAPDEQKIAIVGTTFEDSGYVAIVDLTTGQVSGRQMSQSICTVEWLDNQTILYGEFEGSCSNAFRSPIETWKLNLESGTNEPLISSLDGLVWILPTPVPLGQ